MMIIAEIDNFKKARRVLFVISLTWIALINFNVDLTDVKLAGIGISIARSQAELILFVSGLYTFFFFVAHGATAYSNFKRQRFLILVGDSQPIKIKPQYIDRELGNLEKLPIEKAEQRSGRDIQNTRIKQIKDNVEQQQDNFEKNDYAMSMVYFFALDVIPPTILFGYCLINYFN